MGKHFVIAIIKVLPDDIDTNLENLKGKIIEVLKPLDTELETSKVEPIAFGLNALNIRVKIPEETEGGTQPVEDALEALEEVQRVEVVMVSRM